MSEEDETIEKEAAPSEQVMEAEEGADLPIAPKRQWVTLRGSSIDAHVGDGLLDAIGHDLKSYVTKPRVAFLAIGAETPEDVARDVRRSLTGSGFLVKEGVLPTGPSAASMENVLALLGRFAEAGLTGDDVLCAVGDAHGLSLASFAARSWCGGVTYDEVPLDLSAAILAGPTPLSLDIPEAAGLVMQQGSARFVHADMSALPVAEDGSDRVLLARALFVTTAMADSDKAFERLWDRTDEIVSGDRAAIAEQLIDCLKSRGKIISSTSIAVRQSIDYGLGFVRALRGLVPGEVPESTLLAEAMRFTARISVAQGGISIDDMFTQDEILDRLGLGYVSAEVDPGELVAALKADRFRRSNKFMLELPRALGRVRLAAVDDDLLADHAGAWCRNRPEL